jgi:hypothetical protein
MHTAGFDTNGSADIHDLELFPFFESLEKLARRDFRNGHRVYGVMCSDGRDKENP